MHLYGKYLLAIISILFSFLLYGQNGSNTSLKDTLKIDSYPLKGVEVFGIKKLKAFNVSNLDHKDLVNIPSLTGKPDVLKALQFQAGIRAQNEISSSILVRRESEKSQ